MNADKMKLKSKEKSKSKTKLQSNKINDKEKSNNPFYPIKYFCINEVKKIVNNKNKKSPIINKNNENHISYKKNEKIKKEEEDEYNISIYDKKINLHNKSFKNILITNFNNTIANNSNKRKLNSSDERYKTIIKFGLNTKQIFHSFKLIKNIKKLFGTKKSKFSKKSKIKKNNINKDRIKLSNHYNYLDIHDINNINSNNIIYRTNNTNDSNNTITSNSITSKTITNNTLSNYTISNIAPSSYYNKNNLNINPNINQNISKNKENNQKIQGIKNNNIKIIKNKGRNKTNNMNKGIKDINIKNKRKENAIFVRRIILEETFTIDSKGDEKTLYIKKISPIMTKKEIINNFNKNLINNNTINKSKNKDNTFINHNDINLNFNLCSFQKIHLNNNNNNKKLGSKKKLESFDEECKYNINNDNSINDTILENCKDILNIKNGNKIIYQKSNETFFKTENNHKSYQSLFSSPKKKKFIQLSGNQLNKKNYKKIQKSKKNYKNNINNNIRKSSTEEYKLNNSPLKNHLVNQRYLKNKMVHRKTKTNFIIPNIIKYDNLINFNQEEEDNNNLINKRSFSFAGKMPLFSVVKKRKDKKKIEINNKLKTGNNSPIRKSINNKISKINEYLNLSPLYSGKSSKNNTNVISINNNKNIKKINEINKSNLFNIIDDIEKQRCHSLNKTTSKKNYNSNDLKKFLNYLKNNLISDNNRNKSHINFLNKKSENYLEQLNKKNRSNNKKTINNHLFYMKTKTKNNMINK